MDCHGSLDVPRSAAEEQAVAADPTHWSLRSKGLRHEFVPGPDGGAGEGGDAGEDGGAGGGDVVVGGAVAVVDAGDVVALQRPCAYPTAWPSPPLWSNIKALDLSR